MDKSASLKAFLRKRRNESVSKKTLADDKHLIEKFLDFIGDKELSEDLVLDYLDYIRDYTFVRKGKTCHYSKYSIYLMETKVKQFLAFVQPELSNCITPKMPKTRKLPENMLTEEDIEKLLNACQTYRDKALIAFLYESGCRKGELFSIKLSNVVFDSMGAVVTIPDGKTGARRIRVVFCASYLRQYIENHPNSDSDSYLFCSTHRPYGRISDSGLKKQLKEIAIRAGVKKNVFPHLFRHSRATLLAKHLSEQSLKTYLGWTQGSGMASIYVHLSGQDVDPEILKMHGIVTEGTYTSGLKVGRCPRCHELNPENVQYCLKCGLPLQDAIKAKIEEDAAIIDMEIIKAAMLNPDILEEIAKRVNMKH